MSRLLPWLSNRHRTQKASARPQLETLEDRTVPTVTYRGGNLLTHVEAQALFYGNTWNSSAYSSQIATLNNYLGYIVQSPFMDALTRAGYGVGEGTATTGGVDPVTFSSSTVTDSSIRTGLQSAINAGLVAAPDPERLYVIFVAPNEVVNLSGTTSQHGLLGYHGAFAGHTASGTSADVRYAVIAYPGGTVNNSSISTNAIDDITAVTSHELAEGVTDPDVNYRTLGWYDNRRGEVGDITQQYTTHLNGYLVQQISGTNDLPLPVTGNTGLAAPTVTLTQTTSTPAVGQSMTYTVTVSGISGSAHPTGTVLFLDGSRIIGSGTLHLVNGQWVVTLSGYWGAAGTQTITAVYDGDANFASGFSNAVVTTVH